MKYKMVLKNLGNFSHNRGENLIYMTQCFFVKDHEKLNAELLNIVDLS